MQQNSIGAIDSLLHPSSIAVIGASENTLYGREVLQYLKSFGYKGKIYPINPKRDEVLGLKAFPNLSTIYEPVDIALIIVGRKLVRSALEDCARKGVKSAVVITAGFREADEDGRKLEHWMARFAGESGMRICGPNCAGLANIKDGILMSMVREEGRELLGGNVGFVSQSGALMMAMAGVARDNRIGLSYLVSTGNECDLEVSDFMRYMVEDPDTQVITAFVEGFKDVKKFREVAERALEKKKPIVVLKVGRSELGKEAAASHTAHLTGSDSAYDALFRQTGVIRATDTYDLFETAKMLSTPKRPKGKGLCILTSSGGAGSLTADLCGDLGIHLPDIPERSLEKLLGVEGLLTFGKLANPADIRGQGARILKHVLPTLLDEEAFSAYLICLAFSTVGSGTAQEVSPQIVELSKSTEKPIAVLWIGRKSKEGISGRESGYEVLAQNGIPVFESPLACLRAIKSLIDWSELERRSIAHPAGSHVSSFAAAKAHSLLIGRNGPLNEHESKQLLSIYDIPVPREELVRSLPDARSSAGRIGYPVALKVMSPGIPHKTEADVIALHVSSQSELEKDYERILRNAERYAPGARIQGVLVQEMVSSGIETIIGMSQDPQFGPVLMFGLGGILVELFKDVSFITLPISRRDAEKMIREIKGFKLLEGFRGTKKADIESLIETILRFSILCADSSDCIRELDINPLVVFEEGKGVKALDALAVLK